MGNGELRRRTGRIGYDRVKYTSSPQRTRCNIEGTEVKYPVRDSILFGGA